MLRGTLLWAGLVGFYVIVTLCPASCQLSEEDTETLVELHNSYRGQVEPNSTYMRKLVSAASLGGRIGGYLYLDLYLSVAGWVQSGHFCIRIGGNNTF